MNATLEDGHGSERVVSHCELNSALRGGNRDGKAKFVFRRIVGARLRAAPKWGERSARKRMYAKWDYFKQEYKNKFF